MRCKKKENLESEFFFLMPTVVNKNLLHTILCYKIK